VQATALVPGDPRDDLIERARLGDQQAWQILFDQCYPKIVRVVRRRLSRPMRKLMDSTDVANEVMKSLAAKFDHIQFSSVDGLRAFLIRAAEQKLIDEYRHEYAQKRDLARNQEMTVGDAAPAWELADGSPTPSQVAVASEEQERLLGEQTGDERQVLELKLQGFSNSEVARVTGWHLRKVERFLEKLRGKFRR
jgi:RNA polymerase sigma factor (sigma-70 family)